MDVDDFRDLSVARPLNIELPRSLTEVVANLCIFSCETVSALSLIPF